MNRKIAVTAIAAAVLGIAGFAGAAEACGGGQDAPCITSAAKTSPGIASLHQKLQENRLERSQELAAETINAGKVDELDDQARGIRLEMKALAAKEGVTTCGSL
jgi:hypothetical protein